MSTWCGVWLRNGVGEGGQSACAVWALTIPPELDTCEHWEWVSSRRVSRNKDKKFWGWEGCNIELVRQVCAASMNDGGDEENAGGLSSTQLEQLESRVMERGCWRGYPQGHGKSHSQQPKQKVSWGLYVTRGCRVDIHVPAAAGNSPPWASNRSYCWDVEV